MRRSFDDYFKTCTIIADHFGKLRPVSSIHVSDFNSFRGVLAKTRKAVALGNEINRIRGVFLYAYKADLVDSPIKFGPDFKRPGKKTIRQQKSQQPKKLFTANEVRNLIDAASEPMRTMILLGINCGLGNADCGRMLVSHVDFKSGWLDYARGKTGIDRRAKLWDETIAGLKIHCQDREPSQEVFATRHGNSWFKDAGDSPISKEFRKLQRELGIQKAFRGFYSLRHTFETEAAAGLDQPAVDLIMGHEPQHISSNYVELIHDKRLASVSKLMRRWLGKLQKEVS